MMAEKVDHHHHHGVHHHGVHHYGVHHQGVHHHGVHHHREDHYRTIVGSTGMHATPNIKSRQLAPRARCHVEGLCPDDDAHINVMVITVILLMIMHINVIVMMAILFVEVAFSSFRCHRSLRSGGSPPHPRESCRSPPWR